MTDAEAMELGRTVAAWEGFRWLPGMLVLAEFVEIVYRCIGADWTRMQSGADWRFGVMASWSDGMMACQMARPADRGTSFTPDLRDRPTQAAVMQLIEGQVGRRHVYLAPVEWGDVDDNDASGYQWLVVVAGKGALSTGTTRAEAIAAAVRELSRGDG